MKQFLLISLLALLLGQAAMAQLPERVRHINELFLIENGTDLFIKGGLEHLEGNDDNIILNQGSIHVGDSVVNNAHIYLFGTLPDTLGHVYLRGSSTQGFGGNAMYFSNLSFRNSYDSLELNTDTVAVTNFLYLDSGNLLLNGNQLYLPRITYSGTIIEGTLVGEDNDDNVYGYPGFVRLYRTLNTGTTYTDLHGTGLDIKNEGNLGTTIGLRRYHTEQSSSNGSVTRYFQIYPTISDDVSNVNIRYIDPNDLNGNNEDSLHLFLSDDNGLSWRDKGGSVNTGTNKVSNSVMFPVSNQSRFTLSEDSCDTAPYVNIAADTIPMCNGAQALISAEGVGSMDVYWSTGEANQDSIIVSNPGTYWVRVIDPSGCINFDTAEVVLAPDPVVGFVNTFPCKGDTMEFTDTSSISAGTMSYSWNFGSPFTTNDTSTAQNPKYKYAQAGTYTVTMSVTSDAGCTVDESRTVVVLPIPNAAFSVNNVCTGDTATFTNQSTVSGAAGLTYIWDFADGDSATVASPTHSYDSAATYTVTLIATSNGCPDTTTQNLVIYPGPMASFVLDNTCASQSTQFLNTSTVNSGTMTYAWTMGNGNTSTAANPAVTYTTAGSYTVNLTATSNNGCTDQHSDTIQVYPVPVAGFTHVNACAQDSVVFTNTSTLSTGSMTYSWAFGNGNTSASANTTTSNTYTAAGTYTVTLTATSDSGCVDDFTQSVTAYPLPVAAFSFNNECDEDAVSFQNSTSISSGTLSYRWGFTALDSAFTANPSFTFDTSGTYPVVMRAISNNGCEDTLTQTVTVYPLPQVDLGGDTLGTCGNQLVLDAANSGSSFAWSNGGTQQTTTATFNGNYGVTVTDGNGCANSDQAYVSLMSAVSPNLGPDASVCDSVYLNSSYPANNTFLWSTGATSHRIWALTSGQYAVTVTDQNNCEGYDTVNITVNASPVVDLGADQTNCIGDPITFDAQNSGSTYQWSNGATTQTISVTTAGNYIVTVTNAANCTQSDFAHASFNQRPNFTLGADREACDETDLSAQTSGATYNWSTGATTASITVTASGNYTCTVTLGTGCDKSDTVNITIHQSPVVDLGADTVICSDASILLDAQNAGSAYQWSDSSTTQTIAVNASGQYVVTVTGTGNCSTTDAITITRNPALQVSAGEDFVLCDGASETATVNVENGTYAWGGVNSFSATTRAVTITDTGVYWVNVTDQHGCAGLDTLVVNGTNASLTAAFLAKTTLALGDTIKFVNLSYPTGFTSAWDMGDGFTTTEESPVHPYFVANDYTVTLAVSNGVCSDTMVKEISIAQLKYEAIQREYGALYDGFVTSKLYPNPNHSAFTVELQLVKEATVHMDVYTVSGVLIDRKQSTGAFIRQEFNYNRLVPGIYFVRCYNTEAARTLKFIVID